jgi:hypothetical protein
MLVGLALFSALSFYGYGISCVLSKQMVAEFERFGLARFRVPSGFLQVAGASGLLLGLVGYPIIGFLAALGLSLQMFAGLIVRFSIHDSFRQCAPAFIFLCLNALLAYLFVLI